MDTHTLPLYAGVDIARGAWLAVLIDQNGVVATHHSETLDGLTDVLLACRTIAIDVPIGLPDAGTRACETDARQVLGPRRSSLFTTPTRQALAALDHASANQTNRSITGQGVSAQAYGLRHKIFETEQFAAATGVTLFETHPETAFAVLAGTPMAAAKTTWSGLRLREQVLADNGVILDVCLPAGAKAGVDDMLDAAVAAVSARRIAHNQATCFGDGTPDHVTGHPQHIWV
jgi:predicted RNase H-like nuclease